jgi:drug/metabolite transporter (DMT)-like permease
VALAFTAAALVSPVVWWATGEDPRAAFEQPLRVWLLTVGSLIAFHACVYYAVQNAPPAPAALLQGTTPLMIVLGSALLPGEKLRWWHVAGAMAGLAGVVFLLVGNEPQSGPTPNPAFYLAIVGAAAAIWGLYSLYSRTYSRVPTSAMGVFFAASAIIAGAAHLALEDWTAPSGPEWLAIGALGVFPMGLALYCWDHGVKRGDIQALGAFSYIEPYLGAGFVVLLGRGHLTWSLLWAGLLIVGGAAVASRGIWDPKASFAGGESPQPPDSKPQRHFSSKSSLHIVRKDRLGIRGNSSPHGAENPQKQPKTVPGKHEANRPRSANIYGPDPGDRLMSPDFLAKEVAAICDDLITLLASTDSKGHDERGANIAFRVATILQTIVTLMRTQAAVSGV